jgi:hypothetical protein
MNSGLLYHSNIDIPFHKILDEKNVETSNCKIFKHPININESTYNLSYHNKYRSIRDCVTDAYVDTFMTDNYVLDMFVDYMYSFLNFYISSQINLKLTHEFDIEGQGISSLPLLSNESLSLIFKGGTTMNYIYNEKKIEIMTQLQRKKVKQEEIDEMDKLFKKIDKYFKISDIDMTVHVHTDNDTFRQIRLNNLIGNIIAQILTKLATTLDIALYHAYIKPENINLLNEIHRKTFKIKSSIDLYDLKKLREYLFKMDLTLFQNGEYADIFEFKNKIIELKSKLERYVGIIYASPPINNPLEEIKKFIRYCFNSGKYTRNSIEISTILEFLTYLNIMLINYTEKFTENLDEVNKLIIDNINMFLTIGQIIIQYRFMTLTEILYKESKHYQKYIKINNFLETSLSLIKETATSLISKAENISADITKYTKLYGALQKYRTELYQRKSIMNVEGTEYYYEDICLFDSNMNSSEKYLLNTDLRNVTMSIGNRKHFLLACKDHSFFCYELYELMSSSPLYDNKELLNIYKDKIKTKRRKDINNSIDVAMTVATKDRLKLSDYGSDFLSFKRKNVKFKKYPDKQKGSVSGTIHYVSINKTINATNDDKTLSFDLYRIKFNTYIYDLFMRINSYKDDGTPDSTMISPSSAPAEILDVSIANSNDYQNKKSYKIESTTNPNLKRTQIDGLKSDILCFNMDTHIFDLKYILYEQSNCYMPWLDIKYKKRLYRLFIMIGFRMSSIPGGIEEYKLKLKELIEFLQIIKYNGKPIFDSFDLPIDIFNSQEINRLESILATKKSDKYDFIEHKLVKDNVFNPEILKPKNLYDILVIDKLSSILHGPDNDFDYIIRSVIIYIILYHYTIGENDNQQKLIDVFKYQLSKYNKILSNENSAILLLYYIFSYFCNLIEISKECLQIFK